MAKQEPFERADNLQEYTISEQDNKTVAALKEIYNGSINDINEMDSLIENTNRTRKRDQAMYTHHYETAREAFIGTIQEAINNLENAPSDAITDEQHKLIIRNAHEMRDDFASPSYKTIGGIINKQSFNEQDPLEGYSSLVSNGSQLKKTTQSIRQEVEVSSRIEEEKNYSEQLSSPKKTQRIALVINETLTNLESAEPKNEEAIEVIGSLKEKLAKHKKGDKYDFGLNQDQYMKLYESAQKIKHGLVEGEDAKQEVQSMRDTINDALPSTVKMKSQFSNKNKSTPSNSIPEQDKEQTFDKEQSTANESSLKPKADKESQSDREKDNKSKETMGKKVVTLALKRSEGASEVLSQTTTGKAIIGAQKAISAAKKHGGKITEGLKKQATKLAPKKLVSNTKKAFNTSKTKGKSNGGIGRG